MDYSTDAFVNIDFLIFIVAMIVGFFIILALVMKFFIPFNAERKYIKTEMARSYDEKEYHYWKRELKNLYLRSIPLIGRFFR